MCSCLWPLSLQWHYDSSTRIIPNLIMMTHGVLSARHAARNRHESRRRTNQVQCLRPRQTYKQHKPSQACSLCHENTRKTSSAFFRRAQPVMGMWRDREHSAEVTYTKRMCIIKRCMLTSTQYSTLNPSKRGRKNNARNTAAHRLSEGLL